ncbi:FkbM family methyltransferase [Sporichthya sp.]|uniref:FkbM family methyltransferase n=1 Tax=Sporichthya sp. TaxID=65475 RepID=UPI00179F1AB0|nr:FkbM family methyltransferase [Sporichthya sp.]MBA3741939.1 FkbM family methyltransferase [Sporichthya sp.]
MVTRRFPEVRNAARERVKLGVREVLGRHNLDLVRDPFPARVARAAHGLGIDIVIDVGANIGQFGSALRANGYRGRIISCEPLPAAFARLRSRARRDPSWQVVNRAMGAEPGTARLHVAGNSYSSSILRMTPAHIAAAPGSATVDAIDVPVSTVADVVQEYGIAPERTLLKIDTQGYEGRILDGAADLLPRMGAIQLEISFVTLYEGQEPGGGLLRRMEGIGFELYAWDSSFSDPQTGRLLQADVVFTSRGTTDQSGTGAAANAALGALALVARP